MPYIRKSQDKHVTKYFINDEVLVQPIKEERDQLNIDHNHRDVGVHPEITDKLFAKYSLIYPPTITFPSDGAYQLIGDLQCTDIKWNTELYDLGYYWSSIWEISDDPDFNNIVQSGNSFRRNTFHYYGLDETKQYYVRVRHRDITNNIQSIWSKPISFTPPPPHIVPPDYNIKPRYKARDTLDDFPKVLLITYNNEFYPANLNDYFSKITWELYNQDNTLADSGEKAYAPPTYVTTTYYKMSSSNTYTFTTRYAGNSYVSNDVTQTNLFVGSVFPSIEINTLNNEGADIVKTFAKNKTDVFKLIRDYTTNTLTIRHVSFNTSSYNWDDLTSTSVTNVDSVYDITAHKTDNYVAVGYTATDGYGYVKVYDFDGSNWNEVITLTGGGYDEEYGNKIIYLDSNISQTWDCLIVSNPTEEVNLATFSGAVYIYNYPNTWTPIKITGDEVDYEFFGNDISCDIDNNLIAVGTRNNKVFVYNTQGNLQFTLTDSKSGFGRFVSIQGGYVAVSSYTENVGPYYDCGVVDVYNQTTLETTIIPPEEFRQSNLRFGFNVRFAYDDYRILYVPAIGYTYPDKTGQAGLIFIYIAISTTPLRYELYDIVEILPDKRNSDIHLGSMLSVSYDNWIIADRDLLFG